MNSKLGAVKQIKEGLRHTQYLLGVIQQKGDLFQNRAKWRKVGAEGVRKMEGVRWGIYRRSLEEKQCV